MREAIFLFKLDNMVKVQIIRSAVEDNRNTSGIGYYADILESKLVKSGYKVDAVPLKLSRFELGNVIDLAKSVAKIIRGRGKVDIVHVAAEHCAFLLPFTKSKRIVTFHHVVRSGETDTRSWYIFWKISVAISKMFTDEYVAISMRTKECMIKDLKVPAEKITVATYPPKSEMHIERSVTKENTVLFVGMLMERKNPRDAILVFKKMLKRPEFEKYKLIMCGKGPQKEELLHMISDMKLEESIDIISDVSVDELRGYYNKAKLFLNTSNYEGLGLTTLEAQLCGTPVLYFEYADIPPEVMVAAVPCKDLFDMADKASLLLKDELYKNRIIKRGIEHSTGFGKDHIGKLIEIYNK